MSQIDGFNDRLAEDLDGLAALAARVAGVVRARGALAPAALLARLLLDADEARSALERHLERLIA